MAGKRRRHTPEQIIRKLREADRLAGEGQDVAVQAKQLEVSEQTLHRWRLQYGGLKASDAKCSREPRPGENAADDWRLESDGLGELQVFCPECWQRGFGAGR